MSEMSASLLNARSSCSSSSPISTMAPETGNDDSTWTTGEESLRIVYAIAVREVLPKDWSGGCPILPTRYTLCEWGAGGRWKCHWSLKDKRKPIHDRCLIWADDFLHRTFGSIRSSTVYCEMRNSERRKRSDLRTKQRRRRRWRQRASQRLLALYLHLSWHRNLAALRCLRDLMLHSRQRSLVTPGPKWDSFSWFCKSYRIPKDISYFLSHLVPCNTGDLV